MAGMIRSNIGLGTRGPNENIENLRGWGRMGSALWSNLVMEPLHAMARAGDVIRGRYVPQSDEEAMRIALSGVLAGQGIAHGFGAGGSGVASIGKRTALKRLKKDYTKYAEAPERTTLEKLVAKENYKTLKADIKATPQEQLTPLKNIGMEPMQGKYGVPIGAEMSGYYRPSTKEMMFDPIYLRPTTYKHELTHSSQDLRHALTPKNEFNSRLIMDIDNRLKYKMRRGEISYDDYQKLYQRDKLPHEIHADRMADIVGRETFAKTGDAGLASALGNKAYNDYYERAMSPVIDALKRTAPKTYGKAKKVAKGQM